MVKTVWHFLTRCSGICPLVRDKRVASQGLAASPELADQNIGLEDKFRHLTINFLVESVVWIDSATNT